MAQQPSTIPDFDAMTKTQLLDYAELQGVEISATKTKSEIIEILAQEGE